MEVGVSFTTKSHYLQGNSPQYPLNRRMGGPRASLDFWKREKSLVPSGNQNPISYSLKPINYTQLAQLPSYNITYWKN
jgi:hypothetical protein